MSKNAYRILLRLNWATNIDIRGFKVVILCLIFVIVGSANGSEFYSSVDVLQRLGNVELNLVRALQNYLESQEKMIASYRKFIETLKSQHTMAEEDADDYLGNPINAFTLIKRAVFRTSLRFDSNSYTKPVFMAWAQALRKTTLEYGLPDSTDLIGAGNGLIRMQVTYNISSLDLANGEIKGVFHGSRLDWRDCYEIAGNNFLQKNYTLAIDWFQTTLQVMLNDEEIANEDDLLRRERFKIYSYEYLAMAHHKMGNTDTALSYLDEILAHDADHTALTTRDYVLQSQSRAVTLHETDKEPYWLANYTRLCQGIHLPENESNKLKCAISTKGDPYFTLAPLKIEPISLDPHVMVYHGMLADDQIEAVLTEAKKRNMFRSLIRNETGYKGIPSHVRVSQQVWLPYTSNITKRVYRLVEHISGMDMGSAENLQVANYGIGGQFEPHHDFMGNYREGNWSSRRIATVMIYLSNVEAGGYTVFPNIDAYVRPTKGALLEWHNLHRSADGDYRTLHAGCPVIRGSKRIGNVWLHLGFQELRRPCGLVSDTYKSHAYIK